MYALHRQDSQFQLSSSVQTMEPEICVEARELSFYYKSSDPVLTNINLTVPQGKIYALLGASGCGKTTLLRVILGIRKPSSGTIKVFGHQPGTPQSNIPGIGVGYMPQDLALFKLMSIEENLIYYGSLYNLSLSTIKTSVESFVKLLDLPKKTRIINKLSGGQQRRVSMAVSMIHKPPLLILDEPTVGVDCLLRQKIWNYLKELCDKLGTTVILTTHYTEEAIFSHRVGFIYSGTMLAEGDPQKLMLRNGCTSLEEVFLQLCMQKKSLQFAPTQFPSSSAQPSVPHPSFKLNIPEIVLEECEPSSDAEVVIHNVIHDPLNKEEPDVSSIAPVTNSPPDCLKASNDKKPKNHQEVERLQKHNNKRICIYRFRALLIKHYILFKRTPLAIIVSIFLPALHIIFLCLAMANDLEHIPLAVVNEEQNRSSNLLSTLFIEQIDLVKIDLKYYNNLDQAINAIHSNQVRTVMRFQSNFSKYFRKRFLKPQRMNDQEIKQSNIELYADTTHTWFHLYHKRTLSEAFIKFSSLFGQMIGYNPNFLSPIQIEEPIYGTMSVRFFDSLIPGYSIIAIHCVCLTIGMFNLIRERIEGHLERGFVAGTTTEELLLSNVLFFTFPVLLMNCVIVFISFYVFHLTCLGSLWDLFIIYFIIGFQAACLGIVLPIVCRSEMTVLLSAYSLLMLLAHTSGGFWPIESFPVLTQNIFMWNPVTMPILSSQHVMLKGWPLLHFEVLKGILYSINCTLAIIIFGLIYFRIFK